MIWLHGKTRCMVARERNGLVLRGGGDDILEGTVLVVASARGDCTIFDAAHDDGASRLELCHGYPPESQDAAAPRISLFSPAGGGGPAAIHRGATRSTGEPHVYSVALRREALRLLEHVQALQPVRLEVLRRARARVLRAQVARAQLVDLSPHRRGAARSSPRRRGKVTAREGR